MDKPIWSVPVTLAEVPDTGLHVELEAPEPVRAKLAELAGLRTLPRLTAMFDVTRRGAGLHVAGHVTATAGQTCVVTLEPIENAIEEDVDLLFQPGAPPAPSVGDHRAETEQEPPEPLVGDTIDLGEIASEFLVLGIDPYPRKPGAEFSSPAADSAGEHPFAALAVLKKGPGNSRS
jgi:hypothetical protein